MKAHFNEEGFLDGYATVGDIGDSIEIEAGEDFDESRYFAYKLVDGELTYIEEKYQEVIAEREAFESTIKEENILDILLGVD